MKIKSEDFKDNTYIPSEFSCDGKNVSPQLSWDDVPLEVKSFALSITDPDAIGGWNHWLMYNIPRELRRIEKSQKPIEAIEVENDFGKRSYSGPCPPSGTHRYIFTIYALDIEHLESINKDNFFYKINKHTIQKSEIIGLYKRHR